MKAEVIQLIEETITAENILFYDNAIWKQPLVRFINAGDSHVLKIKEITHKDHLLPGEVLDNAKSVICFFLPFEETVVKSNIADFHSSQEWALAYIRTNTLIAKISARIEESLHTKGYKVGKIPATHNFDEDTLLSNWSHRHLAYLAGLGTFGVNNMLITDKGCCGRFGSIVTDFPVHDKPAIAAEKCLNKIDGRCGICLKRCIGQAYSDEPFDRFKCYDICLENAEKHRAIGYADVCGKCLVGLPCSSRDPSQKRD